MALRMQTATETDRNNNVEGNWNREKDKTDAEEIQKRGQRDSTEG